MGSLPAMSPQQNESAKETANALSRFCTSLLNVHSYENYADVEAGLRRVQSAIKEATPVLSSDFAVSAIQHTVAQVLESIISLRVSRSIQELTFTRAMECYATLVPLLRNDDLITDALLHVDRYHTGDPFARREVIRNVIVPLMAANPSNKTL